MRDPHFIRDYCRVVAKFVAEHPLDEAMALAVGGDYELNGKRECDLLIELGLRPGHFLIDIGCGSGRLSTQLSRRYGAEIDYLGIDIVPELLDYARSKAIADYRFELTKGLAIPARDASADMIAAFSVFTHLKHAETLVYLRDVKRVLRPGGRLVFSFLELRRHAKIFVYTLAVTILGRRKVQNHFISRRAIEQWAAKIGFEVEAIQLHTLGQTIAVLRSRQS